MCKKNQKKTKIRTCMVVCPLNTVLNWQTEFEKWLDQDDLMDVSSTHCSLKKHVVMVL